MVDSQAPTRLASVLAIVTLLAAIVLPMSSAVIWLFWHQLAAPVAGHLGTIYDLTSVSDGGRFVGFLLFFLGAAIQSFGLLGLRQTFLEAASGRAYSARAIHGFTRFAWISVVMVFVGIIQKTGVIVVLSISDPNQLGALSIQFGSDEAKALFMGVLLVFVAHVFSEGKRAKDENEAFL